MPVSTSPPSAPAQNRASERQKVIRRAIVMSFVAERFSAPEESVIDLNAVAWEAVLSVVPTDHILPMWQQAAQDKAFTTGPHPPRAPRAQDLVAAYGCIDWEAEQAAGIHDPLQALPPVAQPVPGFARAFVAHGPVVCNCAPRQIGKQPTPIPATLKTAEDLWKLSRNFDISVIAGLRYWVCQTDACGFIRNADDLPARTAAQQAPPGPMGGLSEMAGVVAS